MNKRRAKISKKIKPASLWRQVLLKWWRHQKLSHQKLHFTRSCSSSELARFEDSRVVSWIETYLRLAED